VPQAVAGFNFGEFKKLEQNLARENYFVDAYANKNPPDIVSTIQRAAENSNTMALGTMDTTTMMKKPLAEAAIAVELYTNYFGPIHYKHVAMTQQWACNYGQSWPTLVYLPICSFFDTTVQHQLGLDDPRGYWTVVAPHEVAHQWWGHAVGFNSYRDQWMSEGFAQFSASLFLQQVYGQKGQQQFIKFWDDQRYFLTQKNRNGFRPIDAGPVTMGYRLMTTRTGEDIPGHLIYPKGGYILHMVRMLMWDPKTGDEAFQKMMHDFVSTYEDRVATTEDFKAIVEKHMTPVMDLDGNHRMDWFFNQFVYGTALPHYKFDYSFEHDASGIALKFKASQSDVDANFRMLVPLYLELANGRVAQLGHIRMIGNNSLEQRVVLNGLKDQPKRAMLNYYDDVLALEDH
jgi:hypothetical protein